MIPIFGDTKSIAGVHLFAISDPSVKRWNKMMVAPAESVPSLPWHYGHFVFPKE
jgi:hypothetical protein